MTTENIEEGTSGGSALTVELEPVFHWGTRCYSCPHCSCGCVPTKNLKLRCTGCHQTFEPPNFLGR